MTEGTNGRVRALLVDAGGTLGPDSLPDPPGVREVRLARLAEVLPELDGHRLDALLTGLRAGARAVRNRLDQRTDEAVAAALAEVDPALAERAPAVRQVLGSITGHEHPMFPDHAELLRVAGELRLRRVLVSNTDWISDEDWHRERMAACRVVGLLDAIVTSYSLGRRKPDRAVFDHAVALAGCRADECVFMGDREEKDVAPALALGMTVIRVAIQSPPGPTRAQHQVTSLSEAIAVLRALCPEASPPLTNR